MRDDVECPREHIRFHHHAGPAARRCVVDGAMLVGCMPTDVDRVERPDARRKRLAGKALRQRAGEHLREDCEYAGTPHDYSVSAGGTTTISLAATSIFGTVFSLN